MENTLILPADDQAHATQPGSVFGDFLMLHSSGMLQNLP
jgi:hypothetical protein